MATVDDIAPAPGGKREIDLPAEDRRLIELERIAGRYYDRLINFLRRHGNSSDEAADLAQDTFARLSAADVVSIRAPGPFLFATARNLLRDRARSLGARHAISAVAVDEERLICPAPRPEDIFDGKEQLAVLENALQELKPKCRAVLVLYRFDELSHRDIADQLGISVSMVEKYLRRALLHCRQRLDEANSDRPQGQRPAR